MVALIQDGSIKFLVTTENYLSICLYILSFSTKMCDFYFYNLLIVWLAMEGNLYCILNLKETNA